MCSARVSVAIEGSCSREFAISEGVRQGAVLSPLLYAVFVDGVVAEWKAAGLGASLAGVWAGALLYADDMVLSTWCPAELQRMLDILDAYAAKWRFRLNPTKTKVMVLGGGPTRWEWSLSGRPLELVSEFRYLGVWFEASGKWSRMTKYVAAKCRTAWGALAAAGANGRATSPFVCRQLWQACVAPVLHYGNGVWWPSKKDMEELDQVVASAARSVLGASPKASAPMLPADLGWKGAWHRFATGRLRLLHQAASAPEDSLLHAAYTHLENVEWGARARELCARLRLPPLSSVGKPEWHLLVHKALSAVDAAATEVKARASVKRPHFLLPNPGPAPEGIWQ
eukprot:TRINITY_DN16553_c0_g1_i1.p1 TRINITY_DN16553_c0_g1~~TRINITY_DN16553_c0_g1_i1.p1  ORF type:complete len:340 (-),score=4.03 TRINITY_DN16553_c0_g1_i1:349-1368(-)